MKQQIRCLAIVLSLVFLSASMLPQLIVVASPAASVDAYECEGNACSAITMTWNEERQQFKVENSSGQEVKVTVTNFAGTSSVIVLPHKENYLEIKTFDGPYVATYQ